MINKKNIILLIVLIVLIIITIIFANLLNKEEKEPEIENIQRGATTLEQRNLWNEFLNENPYLSQITEIITEHIMMSETDLLKIALTTENVPTERIVKEEIQNNYMLTEGEGYKKSKSKIDEYLLQILGLEELRYNFVDTFAENGKYIIIDDDYVYFTEIDVPEKIYIAKSYGTEGTNYEVEIYEYNVTSENVSTLKNMLATGNIDNTVNVYNKYILSGEMVDNNIKINTKTSF